MASTVGVSGFVAPDGRVSDATGFNTRAVVVRQVTLADGRTLATRAGRWPEVVLVAWRWRRWSSRVVLRRRPGQVDRRPVAPAGTGEEAWVSGSVRGGQYPGVGRVLVVIPTYNEADNVAGIVDRVRRAVPAVDVLVADDNSPDGTGAIADELAAADAQVHVLHRAGKQGLGAAYLAGFGVGAASTATTRSWRWTPTVRTPRRSCPRCWTRPATPTW